MACLSPSGDTLMFSTWSHLSKMDHSEITVLDSMNISTSQDVQFLCNLLSVAMSQTEYYRCILPLPNSPAYTYTHKHTLTASCRGKPFRQAWCVCGWKVNALCRLQFPWTLTENNSANSLIISLTSDIPFILLNHRAAEGLDWKELSYARCCCPTPFGEQTFLDP